MGGVAKDIYGDFSKGGKGRLMKGWEELGRRISEWWKAGFVKGLLE